MNIQSKSISAVGHEAMRIAGKHVDLDDRIEVRNPYNGAVVGSVPAARGEHVRAAFAKKTYSLPWPT
jgi:phosphonoacetaldehyde dehydrogenase